MQLGKLHVPPVVPEGYDPSGQPRGNVAAIELARRVIMDLASGTSVPASDLAALANAVLDADEAARLALQVREGGPHALRRGIELAALILATARPLEPARAEG